jgi:hypothetical protein
MGGRTKSTVQPKKERKKKKLNTIQELATIEEAYCRKLDRKMGE